MSRILVCDDASFMRSALKLILEKNGFEVAGEAENGNMAVAMYKTTNPDIVTMDITMPEKDGIQALREILSINKQAKVVMVSALGQESFVKDAIVSGAKGFIVKPFKEETILKALKKLVEG